jgi:glycerol-3-phosphate dehydrogenase (NAD(P)+)
MKIIVFGAGAWGTALAISAGARHPVTLWARDEAQAHAMHGARENTRYLPGAAFPAGLTVAGGGHPAEWAAEHDLAIIATPVAGLRGMLGALQNLRQGEPPRRDGALGLLPHEVASEVAPRLAVGALTGPSFAQEVAAGQPTALVAASADANLREALVQAFHSPALRVYANDDLIGAEVGGAVKNVLAIATGVCDGLHAPGQDAPGLGLNARAALITRGLAEISRLGVALGARADTFMGLTGLGDLVLTATGALSRNRQVGLLLAQGQSLAQAVASLGHVAEGAYSARAVVGRARAMGVDMPICEGVVALLEGRCTPGELLTALMARDPASESAPASPASAD